MKQTYERGKRTMEGHCFPATSTNDTFDLDESFTTPPFQEFKWIVLVLLDNFALVLHFQ